MSKQHTEWSYGTTPDGHIHHIFRKGIPIFELLNYQDESAKFAVQACNNYERLLNLVKAYMMIVGNTGYMIARESAQILWDKAQEVIQQAEKGE